MVNRDRAKILGRVVGAILGSLLILGCGGCNSELSTKKSIAFRDVSRPLVAMTPSIDCDLRTGPDSAARCENESSGEVLRANVLKAQALSAKSVTTLSGDSRRVDEVASDYAQFDPQAITSSHTYDEVIAMFYTARDHRFLSDYFRGKDFLRRIPWLYPDDGCTNRAHVTTFLSARRLANPQPDFDHWEDPEEEWTRPSSLGTKSLQKVFVFGDLALRTDNSPKGQVLWWFHVAPVTRMFGELAVVLDPAVNSGGPILLEEWVKRIAPNLSQVKIAICDADAWGPTSQCNGASGDSLTSMNAAVVNQSQYLYSEWIRQTYLFRDENAALSTSPPWGASVFLPPLRNGALDWWWALRMFPWIKVPNL